MEIPNLSDVILSRYSLAGLYNISYNYNIVAVEKEIARRLNTCDWNIYYTIVDFLYDKQNDPVVKKWIRSVYIKDALKNVINCLPWRIGVIYDYRNRSNDIEALSVMIGNNKSYRTSKGYYKINYDYSRKEEIMLREVVSKNVKPKNKNMSLVTSDPVLDNEIRQSLLNNENVDITTCLFPFIVQTFPVSLREIKYIMPCHFTSPEFSHSLIVFPPGTNAGDFNPMRYKVNVDKSPEVNKLKELLIFS